MMKRTILGSVLAFGLIGLAVPADASPRMTIPENEFDFGITPQGSKVSHIFWLHSAGDDTLKIVSVNPG